MDCLGLGLLSLALAVIWWRWFCVWWVLILCIYYLGLFCGGGDTVLVVWYLFVCGCSVWFGFAMGLRISCECLCFMALRLCVCYWRFSVWFCLGLVRCEFVDLVVGLLAVWFLCLGWVSGSGLGLGWVWVVAFPWV